jgi:YaiO family outer membrane protein
MTWSLARLVVVLLLVVPPADAQTVGALYEEGRAARRAGRLEQALEKLREAARQSPDDTDVQVELGLALTAANRFSEAESALRHALKLAPAYHDARLGLARLAYFGKRFESARDEAKKVVAARPDDKEARTLLEQIERAIRARSAPRRAKPHAAMERDARTPHAEQQQAELPLRLWRFDADGSVSKLTGGRQDWREVAGRISYLVRPDTTVAGAVEIARRNGVTDAYLEGRVDHRLTPDVSAYLLAGGTPEAHFRPVFALAGGVAARLYRHSGVLAASVLTIEGKYSEYVVGPVRMVAPGIEQYLFDGKAWITAKWINTTDERGRYLQGYLVRGDVLLRDDLRVFAGYADAPETSEGATVASRSLFGGISHDLTSDVTLRVSLAYERRPNLFDRRTVSIGATHRF